MAKIRLLLADDHPIMLASVRRQLGEDFDIVGTANNGQEAVDATVRLNPDVSGNGYIHATSGWISSSFMHQVCWMQNDGDISYGPPGSRLRCSGTLVRSSWLRF